MSTKQTIREIKVRNIRIHLYKDLYGDHGIDIKFRGEKTRTVKLDRRQADSIESQMKY